MIPKFKKNKKLPEVDVQNLTYKYQCFSTFFYETLQVTETKKNIEKCFLVNIGESKAKKVVQIPFNDTIAQQGQALTNDTADQLIQSK